MLCVNNNIVEVLSEILHKLNEISYSFFIDITFTA
jgi:hypothetical protein